MSKKKDTNLERAKRIAIEKVKKEPEYAGCLIVEIAKLQGTVAMMQVEINMLQPSEDLKKG